MRNADMEEAFTEEELKEIEEIKKNVANLDGKRDLTEREIYLLRKTVVQDRKAYEKRNNVKLNVVKHDED